MSEEVQSPDPSFKDDNDLRSLVTGHKVMAGILAFAPCCFIPHTSLGYSMLQDPAVFAGKSGTGTPPAFAAILFVAGLAGMFLSLCMAVLTFTAAQQIEQRRGWKFVFVVNCILCLAQPIGTILGIFSLIILNRPTVKAQFDLPKEGHL